MSNRYDTSSSVEGQFEPGSNGLVLANKLGITSVEEIDDQELSYLDDMQQNLYETTKLDQALTVKDLCHWHKNWLENIYEWAGQYRRVNMSKGSYTFAAAHLISKLMQQYEETYLSRYTPCNGMDEALLVEAMAVCHVEFIIVHPFREGNGRLSRVLATIMALQAGYPPLDFTRMSERKEEYFAAIQYGHAGNYELIKKIFGEILLTSQSEA